LRIFLDMRSSPALVLAGLLLGTLCGRGASLDQTLASMDRAAGAFRGMSASLAQTTFTAIINDTSQERGTIQMQRSRGRDLEMRVEFGEPDVRTIVFSGKTAEIYYPKIQTVQVYDLGKHRRLIDQFLLLGFGTAGQDLGKSYSLKVNGEEQVGDAATTQLELTPKSEAMLEHVTKIELWISAEGHPLRQKFYKPSGDYTLVEYSDLKINPPFAKDALRLKPPPGVKREFPQQ
jgi:outer membrane lipoprotein-sorting protein